MNDNAKAILCLCCHVSPNPDIIHLHTKEWHVLEQKLTQLGLEPASLLGKSAKKLEQLLSCSPAEALRLGKLMRLYKGLDRFLEQYQALGIQLITSHCEAYPQNLKRSLGTGHPPFFYTAGDLSLLQKQAIGFVGSRVIEDQDKVFVESTAKTANDKGYVVVSGGAKGVDTEAARVSIQNGSAAIEFVPDSMLKRVKANQKVIQAKRLLILSKARPTAEFQVGMAMERNKYIYGHSQATVVVRSDLEKGGTWTGANEALKKKLAPVLCWNHSEYQGNMELIARGATGISSDWNGTFTPVVQDQEEEPPFQYSLFGG